MIMKVPKNKLGKTNKTAQYQSSPQLLVSTINTKNGNPIAQK